jgi:tetratricopeptide (TPR) repeat protein
VNTAIRLSPEKAEYLFFRGMVYGNMGKFHESADELTRVINMGHSFPLIYFFRGGAYYRMGMLDEAKSDLTREAESDPDNYMSILIRSEVYLAQGKHGEALADINSLWEICPFELFSFLYHKRGEIYYRMGKWHEALQDANRAIGLQPGEPSLYANRALAYEALAGTAANARERTEYQRRMYEDRAAYDRLTAGKYKAFSGRYS